MMKFWKGKETSDDSSSQSMSYSPSPSPSQSPSLNVSPVTGPARPIHLVYCDEKGKFQMDPEAAATLQLVKGPIGVVSVCGRARQGKSFILNQLLGRSSGFQVASTHKPCTKGLWLWSAPIKRIALDGTEYNLLLLDSEGIDAYDQTGTYSTQIFSLAVLLSSMFIYNQMGGIDEAALDRLSLVTEMTKHIRVRASGGKTTASELGQFSPIFVWLLRDFYLDLVEDNRRITPRDYLELALRPVQGGGRDIASKNEIRDSIRALFPDRECFPLVRPLNKENDLQRLDQISVDKLRPEFRAGLDELTKFVFERTRPKQLGSTVMTGPILLGITESYIKALNEGAVPTISSSWQSVEETECRRAFDSAAEAYMSTFDRSKPPEEVALREAHEGAVQKSLAVFNASAVGAGSARQKYEKHLQIFFKKAFEDYKRNVYVEADVNCSNTIQNMEKKLRAACHASDAKLDDVIKVLDDLVSEYEASCHGPGKFQKLTMFLQRSLEGPIRDLAKKLIDQFGLEKSALVLKCRSIEDKMGLLNKQLEASDKYKSDYVKRYEDALNDKKKLSDDYMNRISNLQSKYSSSEQTSSNLQKTLDSARQEASDWKRKYEQALSKQKVEGEHTSYEISILKSKSSAAEAMLAAAREQAKSAQEEADEWKRKYDIAVREAKAALEKAANVQDQANAQTRHREDALRIEFSHTLGNKDNEIKAKTAKIEYSEQCLTTLNIELKAAESKIKSYEAEISSIKYDMKELVEKLEAAINKAQSLEGEARMLEQDKNYLEQKYQSEFNRFAEVQERCKYAEEEAKRSTHVADKARAELVNAQKEKSNFQQLAMERMTQIEKDERHIENLKRQKADLQVDVERSRTLEMDALSKVALLEKNVQDREREIEGLMKQNNDQRVSTVHVLEGLLDTERTARAEASKRAQYLSVQLQATQANLDSLQQELTSVRLNETALDSKLKTASHGKRLRIDDYEMGVESDLDGTEKFARGNKRSRSTSSPLKQQTQPEDGGSMIRNSEDNHSEQVGTEDYTKFTVQKLKQELTKHNFGAELLQLRNPHKKDLVALYERHVLNKA